MKMRAVTSLCFAACLATTHARADVPGRETCESPPTAGAADVDAASRADGRSVATRLLWDGALRDVRLDIDDGLRIILRPTGPVLWDVRDYADEIADELVRGAPMSPPALLSDSAGALRRAYVADSRGNLWRLDLPTDASDDWLLWRVAALGIGRPTTFDTAPEIVRSRSATGRPFVGVLLSGVLGLPRGDGVAALYYLRDFATARSPAGRRILTRSDLADVSRCREGRPACADRVEAGWYLERPIAGEVPAGRALIEGGRVYLTTFDLTTVDCETGEADLRLILADLESGLPLSGAGREVTLGRHRPREAGVRGERLWWPGMDAAGSYPPGLALLHGVGAHLVYWRDAQH